MGKFVSLLIARNVEQGIDASWHKIINGKNYFRKYGRSLPFFVEGGMNNSNSINTDTIFDLKKEERRGKGRKGVPSSKPRQKRNCSRNSHGCHGKTFLFLLPTTAMLSETDVN